MIIKSIYIEKFGCLVDKKVEFNDGLNVISLPNESGKSTTAEFIRVMLYGVNSLRFNQRKQYMPFGSSVMGGELTVECGGTEYIIKRSFGTRKSDDKIYVYNKLSGARIDEYSVDSVGESMCGISGDTFENTCYIKQLSCEINEDKSGEMQSRLINLSQSGNEDYSYKNAVNILDAEIRELSKPRGKINQTQAAINEIVLRRNEKQRIKAEHEACKNQLADLKNSKTENAVPLKYVVLSYIPAALAALSAVVIKPLIAIILFVVFAFFAVLFTLKRNSTNADSLEYARRVGFYESKLESLKAEYEKIDISMLGEYNARLEKYTEALDDLKYAKSVLTEAFEEMQQDYAPRLNSTAAKIFKNITEEKYIEFLVDEKYNIIVRDSENRLVSKEYLSRGTFDQIYFSLRMALVDMIAQDMPIILDDAFALYDDKRLLKAFEYLKSVNNQVIILSCQSREKELLENNR